MALIEQIGIDLAEFLMKFANSFEQDNLNPEEMAKKLTIMPIFMIDFLITLVYNDGQIVLSEKLLLAKDICVQERIQEFKKSVEIGNHEIYLTTIPTIDKFLLEIAMNLVPSSDNPKILSNQEEFYKKIIEESILKEQQEKTTEQFTRNKKYSS